MVDLDRHDTGEDFIQFVRGLIYVSIVAGLLYSGCERIKESQLEEKIINYSTLEYK